MTTNNPGQNKSVRQFLNVMGQVKNKLSESPSSVTPSTPVEDDPKTDDSNAITEPVVAIAANDNQPDFLARLSQTADEIKGKVSESVPQAEQVQAIANFVDQRIRQLGETLRVEMNQTLEASGETLRTEMIQVGEKLRFEMEQLYEQKLSAMRRQSMYQWLISAALVVALIARLMMRSNHL